MVLLPLTTAERTSGEPSMARTGAPPEQVESFRRRFNVPTGELMAKEEDLRLDSARSKLTALLKRHDDLKERLSRDSDKLIFERLQREFEAARAAQTEEINLNDEQWNDGLIATIREKVHIEADRKSMQSQPNLSVDSHQHEKTTYRINNKVILCLDRARIGIQYETFFAGEPCEIYHCVLESKSFLEKMTVFEHTCPFFLPIKEAETNFLSSNAIKFIDYVGDILQSYVDRREQVRLVKELYGNQISEIFHSMAYNMVDFVLEDYDCIITANIRYTELAATSPSQTKVLLWPAHPSKKIISSSDGTGGVQYPSLSRLSYAEEALKTMSLPQAYAEIVLNLPQAIKQIYPSLLRD
ncbi:hypothetical protein LUZ60_017486 [Juncus effusus]|nr:hypothetical protein LUZ60_017486 [Juncus effusus]